MEWIDIHLKNVYNAHKNLCSNCPFWILRAILWALPFDA